MSKVLIVATSRKTRGGITSVVKAHETGAQWNEYHCKWIQTHRDGAAWRKLAYLSSAFCEYLALLPFYDIVHIHCAGCLSAKRKIAFAKIARMCGKTVLVHFHPAGPQAIFDEKVKNEAKRVFDLADKVLVLSPQWIKWINEAFPDRNYNMEVVWNPCPTVKRDESKKKNQILFAGTICDRKGYDVLLKAFGKIAHKYPEWSLAYAGNSASGGELDEIELGKKEAETLGITGQVKWLGWVSGEDKERVFQESSIYCLASNGEGFPMGMLDAWAYGIPSVVTPVGGIPDIVEDGKNGLLFPIGDVDKLAMCLERLITSPELRKSIVCESDKWVYGGFSIKSITEHIGEIYSEYSR